MIILLAWSSIVIAKASVKYYKSHYAGYSPLLKLPSNANNYYGATLPSFHEDEDTASDHTVTMDVQITTSRWTIYNLSRLLISLVQLSLFARSIHQVLDHTYQVSPNEGSNFDILFAFGTRAAFWVKE